MRGGRDAVVSVLLACALVVGGAQEVSACSCAKDLPTFEEASRTAEIAFEGRVVRRWPVLVIEEVDGLSATVALTESYDFDVSKQIRGDFSKPTRLYYSGFCSLSFDEGVEYQVVAYRYGASDKLTVGGCSPVSTMTQVRDPSSPYPREAPSSPVRKAARYLSAVALGSIAGPITIMRNGPPRRWDEGPWRGRFLTAAAVAYPLAWVALIGSAYRVFRKGWSRLRAVCMAASCLIIPSLAVALARAIWLFPNITR